jgi:chemotaxis protein methyltransferase CheR
MLTMNETPSSKKEFEFTYLNFKEIQRRFYLLTGITLNDQKDAMVYSRLARRLRSLKLATFSEYLDYIRNSKDEEVIFANALTTNLTSFFREKHHFEYLKNYFQVESKPLKIWCAACSTGEEPYSIAMTAVNAMGTLTPNIEIYASDIDSNVLAKAKSGVYAIDKISALTSEEKKQFFYRGKGPNAGFVKVIPELQKLIKFSQINLTNDVSRQQIPDQLDVIFCRNVMIYFNKETQEQVLSRLANKLKIGGLYFAGHSENFSNQNKQIKSIGNTIYQRIGAN